MCNKKLYQLFVEGQASHKLIGLWADNSKKLSAPMTVRRLTRFIDERSSGIVAAFVGPILLMVYAASFYYADPYQGILPLWLRVIEFIFLMTTLVAGLIFSRIGFAAFRPNYNKLLIQDLEVLAEYIGNCGLLSLRELNESAKEQLMDAARRVVRAQNIANVHMTAKKFDLCGEQIALADEIKNDDFAPRYNIFNLFGLVENSWEPYFTKAIELETLLEIPTTID